MKFTVCPFCGVVGETPHDSQQACIAALQSEIEHTRQVLTQVGDPARPDGPSRTPTSPGDAVPRPEENSERS